MTEFWVATIDIVGDKNLMTTDYWSSTFEHIILLVVIVNKTSIY